MDIKKIVKDILPYVITIVVVLLIKGFVFSLIRVNGPSMEPTLLNKDIMTLDKISYKFKKIKRFDIVVVDIGGEYIIKRIIGLPGEVVSYKDNKLYVNGKRVKEEFSHAFTEDIEETVKIKDNYYYVLGDNRLNSTDSRILGVVSKDKIMGHARTTLMSFARFGRKK